MTDLKTEPRTTEPLDAEQVLTSHGEAITSWSFDSGWDVTYARGHLSDDEINAELATWPDGSGGRLDRYQGAVEHTWIVFDAHPGGDPDAWYEPVLDQGTCFDLGDVTGFLRRVPEGTPGAVPVTVFRVTW